MICEEDVTGIPNEIVESVQGTVVTPNQPYLELREAQHPSKKWECKNQYTEIGESAGGDEEPPCQANQSLKRVKSGESNAPTSTNSSPVEDFNLSVSPPSLAFPSVSCLSLHNALSAAEDSQTTPEETQVSRMLTWCAYD